MAIIIDGKLLAQKIKAGISAEVKTAVDSGKRVPALAVILVGDDSASQIYVRNKKKDCEEIGIRSLEFLLGNDTKIEELIALIESLNKDDTVDGILVQLPLPKTLDEKQVIAAISPDKDVDAFVSSNVGQIMLGTQIFLPCTPAGVMEMLAEYNIDVEGKECVVVGRSNIVGKPMAMLLLAKNGTVTICHSRTKSLAEVTKRADILVAAVGKAKLITADMVKDGAVVIDVGMNRDSNNKLCGDVDFDNVKEKASYITPVPGGVGVMTRAMLMKNTITSWKRRIK
ncbi:MAG: bifunctional 5,10-methylene-tetrahydrofolate dehydrogenase/5,10-methylene-tetrahydrofolate cyclohydrolase [Clostridiales bacterium GWF2_38_85]|nr:MAG: bifunctional 5,10-methylene-tetrahydrofolate dehydrogenase/5,10-methylene-tetrahydrofolate cyclohydrolase [Clostridiales bacterium GWF2_38_85]HBL83583.1 bifunctional methylenetetrahydrofolate dehydrogenase/methenyltetrahydrofolate cyclohydrolase FolD [Clostridiales bacterium]